MAKAKTERHYPVEGRYLTGVPHVEHDCDDPFHVESGAFTITPPKKAAPKPEDAPASAGPAEE